MSRGRISHYGGERFSKLAEGHERLALKADGTLRLGVVADTHSAPHEQGLQHLAALKPDAILHAGDIGDLAVLERLRAIAPLLAIRGNIDEHTASLPDLLTVDLEGAGAALRLMLMHIAVAGPRLRGDAAKQARAHQAQVVVCGHSHVPFIGIERGLTIFNPGSIGPRRFSLPIVFGVMEVGPKGLDLRHVDCETGKRWEP